MYFAIPYVVAVFDVAVLASPRLTFGRLSYSIQHGLTVYQYFNNHVNAV